jgi:hypothetical protein
MNQRRKSLSVMLTCCAMWSGVALTCANAEETLSQRRERIEQMSPADKDELRRKQQRFNALDLARQTQLRELHTTLAADPKTDELQAVMRRYHAWLKTLTATQRAELRNLGPDQKKRIARVRQLMAQQERQRYDPSDRPGPRRKDRPGGPFRHHGPTTDISPEQMRRLYQWINDYVAHHEDELIQSLPKEMRKSLKTHGQSRGRRGMLLHRWFWATHGEKQLPMNDREMQELTKLLPSSVERRLRQVDDRQTRQKLLQGELAAMTATMMRKMGRAAAARISPERLWKFYEEELTDEDRAELQGLRGSEELRRAVMRKYLEHRGISRGHPGRPGFGPPRRGGPGGRPPRDRRHEPPPHRGPPPP